MFDFIANILVNDLCVWGLSAFIIAVGGRELYRLKLKTYSIYDALLEARKKIGHDLSQNWDNLEEELISKKNVNRKINTLWQEYTRSVKKEVDEDDPEVVRLISLSYPSNFFNEERLVLSCCNMDWFNVVPGILTGLGLLFTFLGLAAGIHLGMGNFNAGDVNITEMTGQLRSLLQGASLAFITSIVGLCMAMIFQNRFKSIRHKLLNEIVKFNALLEKNIPVRTMAELQFDAVGVMRRNREILRKLDEDWQLRIKEEFGKNGG